MVSITSLATLAAAFVSLTAAQNVDCLVNGQSVGTVDLETGSCPFTIPAQLPVTFRYDASDDFDVTFYYALPSVTKFFNDIANAGRVISIPAIDIYAAVDGIPLFQVHVEETPASNSTNFIRKRLMGYQIPAKRDEISDFVESLKQINGVAVPGTSVRFSVVNSTDTSSTVSGGSTASGASTASGVSTASGASTASGDSTDVSATGSTTSAPQGTATETATSTKIITITSCSDNKCSETTVPATYGPTTATVSGSETVYTTWCPITTEAPLATETVTRSSTKIITVTSCSDNKCSETTVPATYGPTTATVSGSETVYSTWCPVASTEGTSTVTNELTTVITVTKCSDNKCHETTVPATPTLTTEVASGSTVVYTVYKTVSETTPAEGEKTTEASTGAEKTTEASTGVEKTTEATTGTETSTGTEATTAAETTPAHTFPTLTITTGSGSTSAAGTGGSYVPSVSSYDNMAGNNKVAALALAAIPLAYFL